MEDTSAWKGEIMLNSAFLSSVVINAFLIKRMPDLSTWMFTTWIVTKKRSKYLRALSFQGTSSQPLLPGTASLVRGSKLSVHFVAAMFAQVSVDASLWRPKMQPASFTALVLGFGRLGSWGLTLGDLAGLSHNTNTHLCSSLLCRVNSSGWENHYCTSKDEERRELGGNIQALHRYSQDSQHKCCEFHSIMLAVPTAAEGRLSKTASKEDYTKMNNRIWR